VNREGTIRVLRVIARLNMGGPALHVAYLTEGLATRGYETTLVTGSLARGEESMAFVAEEKGAQIVRIPQLSREISPVYDVVSVARLVSLIRELRPHVLHTHTAKAGAVGRIAARLAGDARPPVVLHTFHGHVLRGYFDPLRTAVFRGLEQTLARISTALIAISPEVRDDLVRLGVAPASKFALVRLGVELDRRLAEDDAAARARLRRLFGIPDGRFVVGWVGRMTGIKRTDDVLEAFARLRAKGVDAVLCMVGEGPDRDAVERRAHALGIARDCLFPGYQREIGPYYALFDAFLLTSANEGTPVTAIESLASGTPVVSTRVGGVPDVVRDGLDGILVPPADPDATAGALAELARDPELRARMGASGRQHVVRKYAVERLVEDIDLLYRSLLAASDGDRLAAERA
jgi:glycosyltransferase involved in cell wall biosynthesis